MDLGVRQEIARELDARRDSLVEEWYNAIAHTCYIPLGAHALRARLGELLDRVTELWLADSPPAAEVDRAAQQIGADMARLHFVNAEALGQTLRFLGASLPCSAEGATRGAATLHPRLTSLLQGFAAGYFRQGRAIILDEQEQIRVALVAELRAAEAGLRAAHDELEARVEERTAELARANAELHASKERWRTLVENAPDLIGTLDLDGRIRFVNRFPPGASMSVDAVVGAGMAEFAMEPYREGVRRTIRRVIEEGVSATQEMAYAKKGGGVVWHATSFGPIWQNGEVAEVLFVARNVSQRKQLEQMKDTLIHDVSHELRTPLAKIRMSLEMLAELAERPEIDRERMRRVANLAANNVDGLINTIEGILDLSRIESGLWSHQAEPVRIDELIEDACGFLQPMAAERGLLLTVDVAAELPPVAGDGDKLRRVLMNLLDNAIKFSNEGTIRLSAECQDTDVHVIVADQGEGILPENLERVFERFFQEQTRSHGVGIGLAICKAVVEAHGGTIWAESEGRGLGATFHLLLPVRREEGGA